jgi:hypothetical protein
MTINGYDYDENGIALGIWLNTQRQAFNGKGDCKISEEQIEMLKQIGMIWFSENVNEKLKKETINEENTERKQLELYNRFTDYISKYNPEILPSKEEINQQFIEELDRRSR